VAVDALSALGISGFARCGASTSNRCSPFRQQRDGTLVAEGAAAMLLSRQQPSGLSVAICGVGMSCDAGHPTRPDDTGAGVQRAIGMALAQARVAPGEVGAVILHGSGTPANDAAEAAAIVRTFGPKAVPCTSIKGSLGHAMGAAGLLNCLVAFETCRSGLMPPSLGDGPVVDASVDLVTEHPRQIPRGPGSPCIVALCSGFGGNNAAVVLKGSNK